MKPKAIYFYQYLPPWRIDVFNEMEKAYDLTIVFWNAEEVGFTYNREELLAKLDSSISTIFLNNGINAGSHSIRFGIYRIIRSINPDVVFSHEYAPVSIECTLLRSLHLCKFKFFLTTSDNLDMAEKTRGLRAKSRDYILNRADGIIVYSENVEQWYKTRYPKLHTEVCPNIQNPETLLDYSHSFTHLKEDYIQKFGLAGKNVVLFIGRLTRVKGLDLLLDAFANSTHQDWKLVLVGTGEEEASLKSQAEKLGISDSVVFAGFYSGANLYAWYDLANFFVLPSRYEPFGAVVNESLVYGCPVVSSKYIGALDFIDVNNGLVFDPLDEKEFVCSLECAMKKYENVLTPRTNLMRRSFIDYVGAFYRIYHENI